jgi:hypothetical protein
VFHEAEEKFKKRRQEYHSEIVGHIEYLQSDLRKTLDQMVGNEDIYLSNLKRHLELSIEKVICEQQEAQQAVLYGVRERLDCLRQQLEKERAAGVAGIKSESEKLLAELQSFCKRSQYQLQMSQSEVITKLSYNERELKELLVETFVSFVHGSEQKRIQTNEHLRRIHTEQSEKTALAGVEMEKSMSAWVSQTLDTVRDMCGENVNKLDESADKQLQIGAEALERVNRDALSSIEASYEESKKGLENKLMDMQALVTSLAENMHHSITDHEKSVHAKAELICEEQQVSDSPHREFDSALKELRTELQECTTEFNEKTDKLLATLHSISNLKSLAEHRYSTLFDESRNRFSTLLSAQEALCIKKEQELLSKLEHLEGIAAGKLAGNNKKQANE